MSSVAERGVLLVGSDELVAGNVCCFSGGTGLESAEAVKGVGGGIESVVLVDGGGGDFDQDAGGDVLAVTESDAFKGPAGEGCCGGR